MTKTAEICSQTLVRHWSNTGQILVKYWSNGCLRADLTVSSARPLPPRRRARPRRHVQPSEGWIGGGRASCSLECGGTCSRPHTADTAKH
jgi:hypothetical protein